MANITLNSNEIPQILGVFKIIFPSANFELLDNLLKDTNVKGDIHATRIIDTSNKLLLEIKIL